MSIIIVSLRIQLYKGHFGHGAQRYQRRIGYHLNNFSCRPTILVKNPACACAQCVHGRHHALHDMAAGTLQHGRHGSAAHVLNGAEAEAS